MANKWKAIIPKKGIFEKQAWDSLRKQAESKLKKIECPDHHKHPQVKVSGSNKNSQLIIEVCCKKLKDMVPSFEGVNTKIEIKEPDNTGC
jgi:hypothetical protein